MTSWRQSATPPSFRPLNVGWLWRVGYQPITTRAIHAIQDADTALLGVSGGSAAMALHRAALVPLAAITEVV